MNIIDKEDSIKTSEVLNNGEKFNSLNNVK
jgi:hypothetical protein